ncbi:hypothetical protein BDW02DRAFT_374758 [Decorospora gaudefroyi]|uniref:Uncharacterized protein n=1 Tax=Decorospora gaudefroyi TaxID=184978 RepID=A0A6A5KE23_9PLEO|nr:hypothetical protein BDW02DRAFT_374758 [Decorospora gaudefroyi]
MRVGGVAYYMRVDGRAAVWERERDGAELIRVASTAPLIRCSLASKKRKTPHFNLLSQTPPQHTYTRSSATMPHSTNPDTTTLPPYQQTHLLHLLKAKLAGIPPHHLPPVTLASLPTHIPHLPPDLQLAFFLRYRGEIGHRAIKSERLQRTDVTRAVFFYRVDSVRQFQRWHDGVRWNVGVFVALLAASDPYTESDPQPRPGSTAARRHSTKRTHLTPSAHRFCTQYLGAMLEHHNEPHTFSAREFFIRLYKSSRWDFFTSFNSAQKKLLRNAMKRLGREWEAELSYARDCMGEGRFERRVGRFVGCVVPGRGGVSVDKGEIDVDVEVGNEGQMDGVEMQENRNEVLDALRAPFVEGQAGEERMREGEEMEVATVTDVGVAIEAVQRMRPRDMLPVLLRLFPVD